MRERDDTDRKEKEEGEEKKSGNPITNLYDKIPVTFKQVDIFVKILIALLAALIVYGVIDGNL